MFHNGLLHIMNSLSPYLVAAFGIVQLPAYEGSQCTKTLKCNENRSPYQFYVFTLTHLNKLQFQAYGFG